MIYTPYKPFRFKETFDVSTYNNDYVDYTISFGRHNPEITSPNEYVVIYKGKSLVLNNTTEVDLSPVVMDYSYRHNFEYDGEQGFQPDNLFSMATGTLTSAEMGGDIYNTVVRVTFTYNDTGIATEYFNFGLFTSLDSPYTATSPTTGVELYQDSIIENHLPLIYTENYWLSFDWAKYLIEGEANTALLCVNETPQYRFSNVTNYGNFTTSIKLKELYQKLGGTAQINIIHGSVSDTYLYGGTAASTGTDINIIGAAIPTEGDLSNGDKIELGWKTSTASVTDETLAVLDGCPAEWYMAWNDTKGWHSVALTSAWEVDNNEPFTIKNIYDETRNVRNTVTRSFNIKSQKIDTATYNEYCHIIESAYVILYNSKTDRNYFCDLATTTADMTKKKDQHYFEAELTEIINELY